MKKLLAIILAVAMVLSMAVVASADETNEVVVFDKPEGDNFGGMGSWYGIGYGTGYGGEHNEARSFMDDVISLAELKELFTRGGTVFEYTFGASSIDYGAKGGPSANIHFAYGDIYTLVDITDLGDGMYKGTVALDDVLADWEAAGMNVYHENFNGFVIQIWANDFVLYNAKFITVEAAPEGQVTLVNYDFEDGDTSAWAHHWGTWALSIVDGKLHTEKGDQNIMFTTCTNLTTLTKGVKYDITADVHLCDNEYLVSGETGETAPLESATFMASIKTGGIDGTALASNRVTVNYGETETVTFTFTPTADITDAALCFNMDGSDWAWNGVSYCLDNVKVVATPPVVEEPETEIIEVTETVEATFGGTFGAEGDWGTDIAVDFDTVSAGLKKSESWIGFNVNIIDAITAVAPLADIEKVSLKTVADVYEGWQRETAGQESIGQNKVLGLAYGLNTDWSPQFTSYNMEGNNSWSFTKADIEALADPLTKVTVKPFNGKPGTTVNFTISIEVTYNKEVEKTEETYRGSGYFMTGDETHAMIIGKAIITTPHEFNENGDCKYCRYHTDVVVEDIIVEQPTESTEEESEDITVEEPKEDTNPGTGLTLAVIPAIIALAAVVISKR